MGLKVEFGFGVWMGVRVGDGLCLCMGVGVAFGFGVWRGVGCPCPCPPYFNFESIFLLLLADEHTRILNFTISPSMSSELCPYECLIISHWTVTKSTDGSKIGSGEQPSVKQALGILAYARCETKVGGEPFLGNYICI